MLTICKPRVFTCVLTSFCGTSVVRKSNDSSTQPGPVAWNGLPTHVRAIHDVIALKSAHKTLFFSNSPPKFPVTIYILAFSWIISVHSVSIGFEPKSIPTNISLMKFVSKRPQATVSSIFIDLPEVYMQISSKVQWKASEWFWIGVRLFGIFSKTNS